MKKLVQIKNLVHRYIDQNENGDIVDEYCAVDNVSLEVEPGQFIGILGHNGSGKSTLARHINALLSPTEGVVLVNGRNTASEEELWEIRRTAGMVFQNPDNQLVSTIVEEDVGFGPENLGLPVDDIWSRVEAALEGVHMQIYRECAVNRLSGGQKQRVAIAGVLAMKPACIILDEPTAMLDPKGRSEVLEVLWELNRREKITIILITHHMEEVTQADRIFVMEQGKLALSGTPETVFCEENDKFLKDIGLEVTAPMEISLRLKKRGLDLQTQYTEDALLAELGRILRGNVVNGNGVTESSLRNHERDESVKSGAGGNENILSDEKPVLKFSDVSFFYGNSHIKSGEFAKPAVDRVSFEIRAGEFIGIIGATGSGKSTLVQMMNGLNEASSGEIFFWGQKSGSELKSADLCKKIGLVFQYPEYQLFAETVLEDVTYGPGNLGYSRSDAEKLAKEALSMVGLGIQTYELSPFALSGGEKRRTAIAGVLAMKPEVLILDEPTAGLDPAGRTEIFALLHRLQRERHTTIITISHSMEDMAEHAGRLMVMSRGKLAAFGAPAEIFGDFDKLAEWGLMPPVSARLSAEFARKYGKKIPVCATMEELVDELTGEWSEDRKQGKYGEQSEKTGGEYS